MTQRRARRRPLTPTAIRLLEEIGAAAPTGLTRALEHRDLVALAELGSLVREERRGPPPAKTWGGRRAEARWDAATRPVVLHLTLDGWRRIEALQRGRAARARVRVAVVRGDVEYGN